MSGKNISTKTILSNLHLYFFYCFILSIPFQIRKSFLTEHSYFAGGFSEYAVFFVYLSDILLILAVFFWIVKIISNRKPNLLTAFKQNIFLTSYKFRKKISESDNSLKLLALFCLWLIVDLTLIPEDYRFISAYQTLKLFEMAGLFIYVYFNIASFKRILTTVNLLILGGLFQASLAISQYFFQHSIFGSKWIGEIVLSPEMPGVAKIAVNGEKIMRAYGTFQHPNVLAGFLLATILLSWYIYTHYPQFINNLGKNKGFAKMGILRKLTLHNKFDTLSRIFKNNNVSRETFWLDNELKNRNSANPNHSLNCLLAQILLPAFLIFLIFIQILALILTFSRSGWLGFFVVLFILSVFCYFNSRKNKFVSNIQLQQAIKSFKKLSNDQNVSRETLSHKLNWLKKVVVELFYAVSALITRSLEVLTAFIKRLKPLNPQLKLGRNLSNNKQNVSRETLVRSDCFKKFYLSKKFLSILFLALLSLFPVIYLWPEISSRNVFNRSFLINSTDKNLIYSYDKENNKNNKDLTIADRLFYNKTAFYIIDKYPFTGAGLGAFIFQIDDYLNVSRETFLKNKIENNNNVSRETLLDLETVSENGSNKQKTSPKLEFWHYQPAHNIYLLIASEIGVIGLLIFALFITQALKDGFCFNNNVSRETLLARKSLQHILIAIFVGFLIIGLFDHYFWTLQQGRLIFWLVLALIIANERNLRD